MSKTGTTIRYEYNHDGLRTPKFVDTSNKTDATYYTYNGKNIIHVIKNSDHLHIFYDAQNRPAKVSHNGIFYTYLYNLQGDVVGLLDKNGVLVVEYKYDAWGKPLSITGTLAATLGKLNPFRYRGYVYDEETGLYYLRSRYYGPEINRFLCADAVIDRGIANIYHYTRNNVINAVDSDGCTTYAIGTSFSLTLIFGVSVANGICWDDNGNIGTFSSQSVSIGLINANISTFVQVTNLDTIEKLAGPSYSAGASGGAIINGGVDLAYIGENFRDAKLVGVQGNIGVGAGVEPAHVMSQHTTVNVLNKERVPDKRINKKRVPDKRRRPSGKFIVPLTTMHGTGGLRYSSKIYPIGFGTLR